MPKTLYHERLVSQSCRNRREKGRQNLTLVYKPYCHKTVSALSLILEMNSSKSSLSPNT